MKLLVNEENGARGGMGAPEAEKAPDHFHVNEGQ
jgi:hypothetical protein